MDRNLDLKAEYEALQKHSTLLTQQNKDLQRELDSFVETDDIVRRNLDRKTKVDEIRYKVDNAIQQSAHVVYKSRSPIRDSVSKSQHFVQEGHLTSAFQLGNQRGRGASYQEVVHHGPATEQVHYAPARHETHYEGAREVAEYAGAGAGASMAAGRVVHHYEPRTVAHYSEFSPARRQLFREAEGAREMREVRE